MQTCFNVSFANGTNECRNNVEWRLLWCCELTCQTWRLERFAKHILNKLTVWLSSDLWFLRVLVTDFLLWKCIFIFLLLFVLFYAFEPWKWAKKLVLFTVAGFKRMYGKKKYILIQGSFRFLFNRFTWKKIPKRSPVPNDR